MASARASLRDADPVLRQLIDARPDFDPRAWMRDLPRMDAFGVLVFQIIGQQLSVIATRRLLERVRDGFGGRLPTPQEVLAAGTDPLRAAGLSRRKAETIRALAVEFAEQRLSDESLRAMPDDEVERRLTSIPGIGPWTVQGFLITALDRADIVLPGDLALRKAIQRCYHLERLPSEDDVLAIAERWRPYRTLATSYLFATAFDVARAP